MHYHVLVNSQQHGPYSEADLRHYVTSGRLHPSTLTWAPGMPHWVPLSQLFPAHVHRPNEGWWSRNPFSKGAWLFSALLVILWLACAVRMSALEDEAKPLVAELNKMSGTEYVVTTFLESFVRGFLGDPLGTAKEEYEKDRTIRAKLQEIASSYRASERTGNLAFWGTILSGVVGTVGHSRVRKLFH